MTGRANTKLAWVVGGAVVWAWTGLYLALGAPESAPVFDLKLAEGKGGVLLKGRLAELVEDESGIRLTLDWVAPPDQQGKAQPDTPALPDGIAVKYLEPTQHPRPPRIEVQNGIGPVRLPSRAVLVAARDYIFKIDRQGVRIMEAPPGSPLRRKLEKMEEYRQRHPERMERRDGRRGKARERMQERGGLGKRRGMRGPGGEREGPGGPPPEGGHGRPEGPPPEGEGQGPPPGSEGGGGNPPPPEENR